MPIYEYECTKCGNRFERLISLNEKVEIHCDSCNGKHIRRILSPGAFVFKGSGFYATDYKKSAEKPKAESPPSCSNCSEAGGCPAAGKE